MIQLKSKYEIVKRVVNRMSGLDISANSKLGKLPFLRYVYYQICKDFDKDINISECSRLLNRTHSHGIYALKKFNQYKNQKCFKKSIEFYNKCKTEIKEELKAAEYQQNLSAKLSKRLNRGCQILE